MNERQYNDWDMPQIEDLLPEGECDDMLAYESQFEQQSDQFAESQFEQQSDQFASDEPIDMTDVEADADTLASAGWGTDEDYGHYGCDCYED